MNVGCETHVGLVRTANEDSYFVDQELGLFIVADGLGGHKGGEVASAVAVREISNLMRTGISCYADPVLLIEDALLKADQVIYAMSIQEQELRGMGTTVVLAYVRENSVWIAHVGDSRAYVIRSHDIVRLTEDHTLVAQWVVAGVITVAQARDHPLRHMISMALGTGGNVLPTVSHHLVEENDRILLCSDGLTEMLSDSDIFHIVLSASSPQAACKALVAEGNRKGGRDNITTVVVCRN